MADDPQILFERAMAEATARRGAGNYDEAVAQYRRATELRPDNPTALQHLGAMLAQLTCYAEAWALYEPRFDVPKAKALRPDLPFAQWRSWDWRWMAGRDDTPWYPTMRLYRGAVDGDWRGAIGRLVADIAAFAAGR